MPAHAAPRRLDDGEALLRGAGLEDARHAVHDAEQAARLARLQLGLQVVVDAAHVLARQRQRPRRAEADKEACLQAGVVDDLRLETAGGGAGALAAHDGVAHRNYRGACGVVCGNLDEADAHERHAAARQRLALLVALLVAAVGVHDLEAVEQIGARDLDARKGDVTVVHGLRRVRQPQWPGG